MYYIQVLSESSRSRLLIELSSIRLYIFSAFFLQDKLMSHWHAVVPFVPGTTTMVKYYVSTSEKEHKSSLLNIINSTSQIADVGFMILIVR
jgi:hypothetical protein